MTAEATPVPSPDSDLLTAYLDAPYGDVSALVRAQLAKGAEILDLQIEQPEVEFRETVLEAMRDMTRTGHTGIGFPQRYGGGADIGASIASVQALGYSDLSLMVKAGVQFGLSKDLAGRAAGYPAL